LPVGYNSSPIFFHGKGHKCPPMSKFDGQGGHACEGYFETSIAEQGNSRLAKKLRVVARNMSGERLVYELLNSIIDWNVKQIAKARAILDCVVSE